MKNLILICFFAFLFLGCEKDCNVECVTGPAGAQFEVVDKTSGENLFTTGLYEGNDIRIENPGGEPVEYHFISENNINLLVVSFGWGDKTGTYNIQIGEEIKFKVFFVLEERGGECCTSTYIVEIKIEGIDFEQEETTGLIKILVDTGANN